MHFEYQKFSRNQTEMKLRDDLQVLFDQSFVDDDKHALREQYKTLRQLEFHSPIERSNETTNVSALTENLTIACDTLLTEMNTSFVFCGNDTSHVFGNPRLITKAILNLLSNAYLYSSENLITVKTIEFHNYVKIEVQSGGTFTPNFTYKNGLQFVNDVCRTLSGRFFIEQDLFSSRSIMILPKSSSLKFDNCSFDYYDLITDRLSPVYIELFGMEYH